MKNQEVENQKQRFDKLINKIDLPKLGLKLMKIDFRNKLYSEYEYAHRFLKFNGVHGSMYHPDHLNENLFYYDILREKAIKSFFDSLKEKTIYNI